MDEHICPRCKTGEFVQYLDGTYTCMNIIGENPIQIYGKFDRCWYHFKKESGVKRKRNQPKKCRICDKLCANDLRYGCNKEHDRQFMTEYTRAYREKRKKNLPYKEKMVAKSKTYYSEHKEEILLKKKEQRDKEKGK